MDLDYAYKLVFNDLLKCNLFKGIYDAKNGKEDFMFGINTVMEFIAYNASEETGIEYSQMFYKNMIKSEEKIKNENQ